MPAFNFLRYNTVLFWKIHKKKEHDVQLKNKIKVLKLIKNKNLKLIVKKAAPCLKEQLL